VRYQLHDAPVPSVSATTPLASEKSEKAASEYVTARPPTTRYESAISSGASTYKTAKKTVSEYSTAPPPPASPSITPSELLSWRSYEQDLDEAATFISEESDLGLIADLERQSSYGSDAPRTNGREMMLHPVQVESTFATAQDWSTYTGLYDTAGTGTVWETARESNYVTAPSWSTPTTYMTTARGTQE
jgi:hypothetical protein